MCQTAPICQQLFGSANVISSFFYPYEFVISLGHDCRNLINRPLVFIYELTNVISKSKICNNEFQASKVLCCILKYRYSNNPRRAGVNRLLGLTSTACNGLQKHESLFVISCFTSSVKFEPCWPALNCLQANPNSGTPDSEQITAERHDSNLPPADSW